VIVSRIEPTNWICARGAEGGSRKCFDNCHN